MKQELATTLNTSTNQEIDYEQPNVVVTDNCDLVDVSPETNEADIGTAMVFHDESCIKVRVRPEPVLHHNTTQVMSKQFLEFLSTPRQILSGSLPTTVGSVTTYNPTAITLQASQPWIAALANAIGLRCTFHYTINIAATPFHAGILRAAWQPKVEANSVANFPRVFNRQGLFTLPGVTFNLQDTTQVQMEVPWTSNIPFMSLRNGANGTWAEPGTFHLWNLTDVTPPAGTNSPTYTVFMHMTDCHTVGPDPESWSAVQPQMGVLEDLRSSKAISSTLAAAGRFATSLGGIPVMPKVVGSAGWVLTKLSQSIAILGFSKPIANAPIMRMIPMRQAFATNSSGEDPAANLGLFHDSAVPVMPASGTRIDEQSVAYISRCPGLINDFTVSSQVAGTLVYSCALCPTSLFFQTNRLNLPLKEFAAVMNTAPFPAIMASPSCGVATLASYWKSDFKFDVYISKTRFHTGRLAFVYVPASFDAENAIKGVTGYQFPPYASTYMCSRQIVDLRETSTFSMEIPYININPMCTQTSPMGYLCVYVVDPVRAPTTVGQSIRLLVGASCPNMELSGITGTTLNPTNSTVNFVAQMSDIESETDVESSPSPSFPTPFARKPVVFTRDDASLVTTRMMTRDEEEVVNTFLDLGLDFPRLPSWNYVPQMNDTLCDTGEEIKSLGTVSRRTVFRNFGAGVTPPSPFEQNLPVYLPSQAAPTSLGVRLVDLHDFIRSAYLYERGGMIVQIGAGAASTVARAVHQTFVTSVTTEFDRLTFNPGDSANLTETVNSTPLIRAYIPRYSPYTLYKASNGPVTTNIASSNREVGRVPPTTACTYGADGGAGQASIYGRACADDHSFQFFVGWPPLVRGDFTSPVP